MLPNVAFLIAGSGLKITISVSQVRVLPPLHDKINTSTNLESPFLFRVQFVCKRGGNNGNNRHSGHFLAQFIGTMDSMDAITRCGHLRR